MSLSRKKIIIYAAITIVVLGTTGFVIYRRFLPPELGGRGTDTGRITGGGEVGSGPEPGEARTDTGTDQTAGLTPTSPGKKLQRITDFSVVSPSLNKTGDRILFYQKNGGDLFSSGFSGKEKDKISNITIVGLIGAQWKTGGDGAAVFYLDQETMKGFLHSGTSTTIALPQNIKSFSWSPDGKSLAYLLPRGNKLDLIISDVALKNPKAVFSTPILDSSIVWVSNDKIVFETAPSGLAEGYIFSYSRGSGSFSRLIGPLFGLASLWSPDGSRMLAVSTDGSGRDPSLAVYDASGKNLTEISLKTLPEKCVWIKNSALYCAAPKSVPQNVLWPDNYLRGELNTKDTLFFMDLAKNESFEVSISEELDMSNLLLSLDNKHLFFINRVDGTLWGLEL